MIVDSGDEMKCINRIILHNFKKFKSLEILLNARRNLIIGENESGKSSILLAINLVLSGSRNQFESYGSEKLINAEAVKQFMAKAHKQYNDLPKMYVELWLNEQNDFQLNGKNNSKGEIADGLVMECVPNDDFSKDISEIIQSDTATFPFDFYEVKFYTFQGDQYSGYKKYLRHILVDTSSIGGEYAMREYVKGMYETQADLKERHAHQHGYRRAKDEFRTNVLLPLNARLVDYSFSIKNDQRSNLEADLTILESEIAIENRGKGRQCFIKTDFALSKAASTGNKTVDIILLEEPENHLSHVYMRKLVDKIVNSEDRQIVIATHSNMLSARLDLRNGVFLHGSSVDVCVLSKVPNDTAEFFVKAPDHSLLDFVLSDKVILVEGDAEYILMERFFKIIAGKSPEAASVYILAVDGTSFKRYLDVAKVLSKKVAVVRDNDKDYNVNCVERYSEYVSQFVKVFADKDNSISTLEICLYKDNVDLCENLFAAQRRTLSVQDYMLKNKTDAALALLKSEKDPVVPVYINEAIKWISA